VCCFWTGEHELSHRTHYEVCADCHDKNNHDPLHSVFGVVIDHSQSNADDGATKKQQGEQDSSSNNNVVLDGSDMAVRQYVVVCNDNLKSERSDDEERPGTLPIIFSFERIASNFRNETPIF